MKKNKIKQLILDPTYKKFTPIYDSKSMLFNLSYINDKSKNILRFSTTFSSCRAYITDSIRTIVSNEYCKGDAHSFKLNAHKDVKLNSFLLGICFNIEETHLLHSIKIINYYNDITNFPKFKVAGKLIHNDRSIFFIKIPMIYKKNPHLFSLFTLFLRSLTLLPIWLIEDIKNIEDFEKFLESKEKIIYTYLNSSDKIDIYKNYKTFKIIFDNYKNLFNRLGDKSLFPTDVGYTFHNSGGIVSLCESNTSVKILNERMKDLKN